jgi:predicted secreted hydrolase
MKSDRRSRTSYRGTGPGLTRSRVRRSRDRRLRLYVVALALLVGGFAWWMLHGEHMPPPPPVVASAPAPSPAPADASPANTPAPKPAERTAALAPLNLPADDAPHGSRMEWWYYNGILRADSGDRYAFHVAVFVANGLVKHTVMHVALTDLQTGKHHVGQSRTAGIPADSIANGFDISQDGWQVKGGGKTGALRADFDGVALALTLDAAVPVVAHRATGSATPGLLDFGASGISYYYSRPRMPAHGRVTVAGKTVDVSGDVWFDHQWGDFDVLSLGWNWFALHLADGSDLMLYQLFDDARHPVMTAGTLSDAKGSQPLDASAIELTPVDSWTSPSTRIAYPVAWKIKLPTGTLEVKPLHADSEFDSRQTTANVYWEGPVQVSGSSQGQGFLELSGYDRPQAPAPSGK